jgi:hypothetical protein
MPINRNKLVEIAKMEAMPPEFGKVSDNVVDADGNRAGWRSLKDYFEKACGWTDKEWQGFGYLYVGSATDKTTMNNNFLQHGKPGWKRIQFIDGIKKPKYRIPQAQSKPTGISWCGIFATWVWRQAGLNVRWVNGQGIVGSNVKRVFGNKGFSIGDVVILNSQEVHHCLVSALPNPGSDSIETVNGNSRHDQRIETHNRWLARNVAYYYKILD